MFFLICSTFWLRSATVIVVISSSKIIPSLNKSSMINQCLPGSIQQRAIWWVWYKKVIKFYSRDNSNKLSEISDERALEILKAKFLAIKPTETAGLAGNILDCESIFAFKLFLNRSSQT